MNLRIVLTELVDCLSDLGASLDALEAELIASGQLTTDAISRRFAAHKSSAEFVLAPVRSMIAQLPE
jgi:hypothetical protein